MSHTCGNILIHLVFSTKDRLPLIQADFQNDLFAYIGGIVRGLNGTGLIVSGTKNHVHMLMRIRPTCSVAEATRVIKANSSRWARQQGHFRFAWQTGYGAFSVSESNVSSVTKYIASQEEHHKTFSFEDEFRALLKKNHIEYDEQYLWG